MTRAEDIASRQLIFCDTPMGKPRQTQRDKWKQRPVVMKWRTYADRMRSAAKTQKFTLPTEGADFIFYIPMPESWSEKKKREMENSPHQQKPDIDNLTKGVMDALLEKDETVWHIGSQMKLWAREGQIVVTIHHKDAYRPS